MRYVALVCALTLAAAGGCASTTAETHKTAATEPPAAPQATSTVSISSTSLPSARVSVGYRTVLSAGSGVAQYRWKLSSGSLPAGLVFGESAGVIVGVPEQDG